ncbi:MAG: L-ribulose-5-phosphate 4-epimerase AraD [Bacilli bacterium]
MSIQSMKKQVYLANKKLGKSGLVILTWGNVSMIDRTLGLVVIKPSGVSYRTMKEEDMVVVNLNGEVVEGSLKPSVDLLTHLELYKHFPLIESIVHDHSTFATAFAQAGKEIPPYGTTQGDTFYGSIPITQPLEKEEVENNYTQNTGLSIIKRFEKLDYQAIPGVLVYQHGVFAWGNDPDKAVENALIIEQCAKMAYLTLMINSKAEVLPKYLLDEHYLRKHGKKASYGQERIKK